MLTKTTTTEDTYSPRPKHGLIMHLWDIMASWDEPVSFDKFIDRLGATDFDRPLTHHQLRRGLDSMVYRGYAVHLEGMGWRRTTRKECGEIVGELIRRRVDPSALPKGRGIPKPDYTSKELRAERRQIKRASKKEAVKKDDVVFEPISAEPPPFFMPESSVDDQSARRRYLVNRLTELFVLHNKEEALKQVLEWVSLEQLESAVSELSSIMSDEEQQALIRLNTIKKKLHYERETH